METVEKTAEKMLMQALKQPTEARIRRPVEFVIEIVLNRHKTRDFSLEFDFIYHVFQLFVEKVSFFRELVLG